MFLKLILLCLLLIKILHAASNHPILIVVSYDAFRYNFFDTKTVPNMLRLRASGTYADHLINVFPTKTFPNHHSIATGLYPETHGVIGNSYYDATSAKIVKVGYDMFHYNEGVVPIYRRNEDAGEGRYSGIMMWPGGVFPYQNKNVTYCQNYDTDLDWFKRIDTVISWINDREKPANLVMVYFEEPDQHGHAFGPNSPVVYDLLRKLDNVTEYLERQLIVNNLKDKVNVIHLSDHGLTSVKPTHFINVTQYLTPNTYKYAGATPVLQFIPNDGYEDEIYEKLKKGSKQNGHFNVYKKSDYPDRWHYKLNPRSPPILVMADVGYGLDDLILAAPHYAKKYNFNLTSMSEFGVHGYDNLVDEMHPFFMARGPKIQINHKVPPFNTVDLYNLFCEILEISASTKNNGTLTNISDIILVRTYGTYTLSSIIGITVGGILITLILVSCAAVITLMMIKRQQNITTTAALNKRFPQTFQTSIEAQHLLEPEDA